MKYILTEGFPPRESPVLSSFKSVTGDADFTADGSAVTFFAFSTKNRVEYA